MIEQLKNLPRAEQEKIARQYGINLTQLTNVMPQQNNDAINENDSPRIMQRQSTVPSAKVEQPDFEPDQPVRFGLKLFDAQISSFASLSAMPVPDSYRLGPDDSIQLQLYGKVNQQYELSVNREGELQIPELGNVVVAGLSFPEVQQLISEKVGQAMLGVKVAVSMGKLRSINVFIAGEAKHPGTYTLSALSSVTQALFAAGGVSDIGSLRQIQVRRQGKLAAEFDLYALLLQGKAEGDIALQHGDVIFVSTLEGVAQVDGEVRRPALFEIKPGETISNLLSMAGGVNPDGYNKSATLERLNKQRQRELVNIDLTVERDLKRKLQAGDFLKVNRVSPRVNNQVALLGAVVRPGFYAYQPDMRISGLIRSLWGDLHATADPDYGLVLRQENLNQPDISVLQFNVSKAVNAPGSEYDVALAPGDKVLVFNYANDSYQRTHLKMHFTKQYQRQQSYQQEFASLQDFEQQATDVLSAEALQQNKQRTHVADMRINDNLSPSNNTKAKPDFEPLSIEEMRYQQQDWLKESFRIFLSQILYDKTLMHLSPHLTRRELLYPVLQQLNKQARNGNQPHIASITGEVMVPGEYPLAINTDLYQLISAAGGVKASANLARAELTRYWKEDSDNQTRQVTHLDVSLTAVLNKDQVVGLQSRDNLNVFALPDWNQARVVEVRGEVRFPGRYPVRSGETLSSLLSRAGGLTSGAFTQGAVFTREMIKEREKLQLNKLLEQLKADVATRALSAEKSMINPADAIAMVKELQNQTPVGRFVVDLPGVISGNVNADLELEEGDVLYIPRKNTAVTVVGEVQHASSHRYKSGMSVDYYLQQAGGFRKRADEDAVYVIRADGSVMLPEQGRWFAVNSNELAPGDTIVVPLDTEYKDNLSLWSQVTQIFYQSAVALVAISSL
nr:SLBB domain-containing protein [Rheinheimera maricola]